MGEMEVFGTTGDLCLSCHGGCCFPVEWATIPTMGREAPMGGPSKTPQALLQRWQEVENHKPLQDPRQYQILPQTQVRREESRKLGRM